MNRFLNPFFKKATASASHTTPNNWPCFMSSILSPHEYMGNTTMTYHRYCNLRCSQLLHYCFSYKNTRFNIYTHFSLYTQRHFTLVITKQSTPIMFFSKSNSLLRANRKNNQSYKISVSTLFMCRRKHQEGEQSTVKKLSSVNIFQHRLSLVYISHPKVYRLE